MLSIEALIVNAVRFVQRYFMTSYILTFRTKEAIRMISSSEIHATRPGQQKGNELTNPHVFFILSHVLMVAAFGTLLGFQRSITPLSPWALPFAKLAGTFTSHLTADNFVLKSFHFIGIALFLYLVFYVLALVFTRPYKNRVIFTYFLLYWYGVAIMAYLLLFFIMPNLLNRVMPEDLEQNLLRYVMYGLYIPFLLLKPLYIYYRLNTFLLLHQSLIVGLIGSMAVWSYPDLYFSISNALHNDRRNEIFLRNLNLRSGSQLCVTKAYKRGVANLTLHAILANNSDAPIYINKDFQLRVKDETSTPTLPDMIFSQRIHDQQGRSFHIIHPKTFIELSLHSVIDSVRASEIERTEPLPFAKSHYTASFDCIVEGTVLPIDQHINILCSR